ncbi:hypothetical protein RHECNPAF_1330044 [Rhizobium etli CNPAF512]|nr:hypothetical protein RHECNPAF_1330044 [Rhizobium etli CNPAF512]
MSLRTRKSMRLFTGRKTAALRRSRNFPDIRSLLKRAAPWTRLSPTPLRRMPQSSASMTHHRPSRHFFPARSNISAATATSSAASRRPHRANTLRRSCFRRNTKASPSDRNPRSSANGPASSCLSTRRTEPLTICTRSTSALRSRRCRRRWTASRSR